MRSFAAIILCCALSRPLAAWSSDTAMFRSNAQHTGVYQSDAVLKNPHVQWKFHTGGPVISSPAVVGDSLYVGSTDGGLYAIDSKRGTLRWKYATRGRVVSSPAVASGVVYFSSYDGNVYALDAKSGKLRWKFQTSGERRFEGKHLHGSEPAQEMMPDPFDVYLSSPTAWKTAIFVGSGFGDVYSLDAATGREKWRFHTGDVVHASPAVDQGTVFIGSWDRRMYALDATTGHERWRFVTGADPVIHNQVGIQSSPVIDHGSVYFGCRDSHLYALNAHTGRLRWSFPTHGSWVVTSPAVDTATVYFATSDSSIVYALRASNGEVLFSRSFHGWPFFSSPAIAGGLLYIGSWSGTLAALDRSTGAVVWSFQTEGARRNAAGLTKADGSPNYEAAYRSAFYDDIVVGFNKMMSVGSILSSPVVARGTIFFGSSDGNIYAIH